MECPLMADRKAPRPVPKGQRKRVVGNRPLTTRDVRRLVSRFVRDATALRSAYDQQVEDRVRQLGGYARWDLECACIRALDAAIASLEHPLDRLKRPWPVAF